MDNYNALAEYGKRLREIGSLYHFNHEVLGYREMAEEPHRLMCDSIEHGGERMLHLWPRGHFKSTMITVGDSLRRLSLDPNLRIFIGNLNLSNSKSFLREIKGHLERNERLQAIIGNQVPTNEKKWTETQIELAGRTKNLKEPSIQVAGVGQSLASQHYDVMYLDDLIDQTTVTSPEQREKTLEWYRLAISLLEPGGKLIIIGTRYHYDDLYGYLIREYADRFDIQVHSAFNEDGEPIFPSRFTREILNTILADQKSYIFSCQYLNNPVDDESAKFKLSNFRYYEEKDLETKQLYTTMAIDRAYSLARTADYTGITIRSVDLDNKWYIRYAARIRAHEGKIIDMIFDLKNYYKVDKVGIEQKAFNDTIKPVLDEEMRRRNDFFTVEELKGRASKIARVEALVPRFESHSIFFLQGFTDLEDELLRFPVAEHDDLADSLAYHNDLKGAVTAAGYGVFNSTPGQNSYKRKNYRTFK